MKIKKFKSVVKTVLSAVLVTGICTTAFAAANEAIFKNGVGKTIEVADNGELPLAPSGHGAEAADFSSADYEVVDAAVELPWHTGSVPPENAISAQGAADGAALYLWDVFGYSPKGKIFNMLYSPGTHVDGRGRWEIFITGEPFYLLGQTVDETNLPEMECKVDAITGLVVSASKPLPPAKEQIMFTDAGQKQFWLDSREEYFEIAKAFAEKHFSGEAASAKLESWGAQSPSGKEAYVTDEEGAEILLVDYTFFDILVKDVNGDGIVVSVAANTKEVMGFGQESWVDPYNRELWAGVFTGLGIDVTE
jgi:hypothetical protein